MHRLVAICVGLGALSASAESPDFSKGGVVVSLQYGAGFWSVDKAKLTSNPGVSTDNASLLASDLRDSSTAVLRAGYNILGHATVAAELMGTGWDLFSQSRGGAGFLTGTAKWHPLQLVYGDRARPIPIDAGVSLGFGYGIAGQTRGFDGFLWDTALEGEYYLMPWLAAGLGMRLYFLNFGTFYIDYDHRGNPGSKIALPNGSGGTFFTMGLSLIFRLVP
jgi:hypothetical protein